MLNIHRESETVTQYNSLYQQLNARSFAKEEQPFVQKELLILKQKLALIIRPLLAQYYDESILGIQRLNKLVTKYNNTYDQSMPLLQLPPGPPSLCTIDKQLKPITPASLGLSVEWQHTAAKTGWVLMGIVLNVVGCTAARFGMRAASRLLQTTVWNVSEIIATDVAADALKAAALSSLSGAAFVAPLIGERALATNTIHPDLLQNRLLMIENEDEPDWETLPSAIHIRLTLAAQEFSNHGDPISAHLLNDLSVLKRYRDLLTTPINDETDITAIVRTLEFLTYYFKEVYPDSLDILYGIIQDMDKSKSDKFKHLLLLSKPASWTEKSYTYILGRIAAGYELIDWTRIQRLRSSPPTKLLETLAEIRQYNQQAINQLYSHYLTEVSAIVTIDENCPCELHEKDEVNTPSTAELLQKFSSDRIKSEESKTNTDSLSAFELKLSLN